MATPVQCYTMASVTENVLGEKEVTMKQDVAAPSAAPEIKSTLLKMLDLKSLEPRDTQVVSCSTSAARMWWPNMKKAFSDSFKSATSFSDSFRSSVATPRHGFQISTDELRICEQIGGGLRCDVFNAEFRSRRAVVKRLRSRYNADNEDISSKMVDDFEALSNCLRHPNIVECLGVSLNSSTQAASLVFEFMPGGTLEDYFDAGIEQRSQVPFERVLSWTVQLFECLTFLHERDVPIIVRDLKPGNILLSAGLETLKLQNFGVSKTVDLGITLFGNEEAQAEEEIMINLSNLTGPSNQVISGTARYMAPEIEIDLKDEEEADFSSAVDIYSAALIMWFMLEGERPWAERHGHVALALAKTGRRPPLLQEDTREIPELMAGVIQGCWHADPEKRPSAREVLEVLNTMSAE